MRKMLFKTIFVSGLFVADSYAQTVPNELLKQPNSLIVTVGGFLNFTSALRLQESAYEKSYLPDSALNENNAGSKNRNSNRVSFANDSEIYVKAGAISKSGVKYGVVTEFEVDVTSDAKSAGLNADKAFVFAESQFGKFEFGNNNAVNQKMKVGPSYFARATGGISGKYLEHVNLPMLANSTNLPQGATAVCEGGIQNVACANVKLPSFILIPQSPVAHGGYAKGFYNEDVSNSNALVGYKNGSFGQMEDATKISYYTPRINGWQAGVSFAPDTKDSGAASSIAQFGEDINNVVSWGLNYSTNLENVGVALSLTGENGVFEKQKNSQISHNNLAAYDAGLMFTYFGFTIGGSYGYWGKSLQPKNGVYSCDYNLSLELVNQDCSSDAEKKFGNASYYTGGIAYEFGPIAASVTYMASNFQKNKYQATSFGLDYKIVRGFMPYFEVTKFKFESNQPQALGLYDQTSISNLNRQLKDNSGYVALVGAIFAF